MPAGLDHGNSDASFGDLPPILHLSHTWGPVFALIDKHRWPGHRSEVTHVFLFRSSSNLTNLSPLLPTLNPYYSRVTHTPHTYITQGPRSRNGFLMVNVTLCIRHGKCHACLADGSIFVIRWRYVYCFSLPIGLLPLHPSQQQGAPLCKSEPPFCSILVPALSKTLIYLEVSPVFMVFARLVPWPSRSMLDKSNFFEELVTDLPTGASLAIRATRILI